MKWAITSAGVRVPITPGAHALCPLCGGEVISKCGAVKLWHWAHASNHECDSWYKPESLWHREMKGLFPEDFQEVVLPPHRADVATARMIVEFQNSPISEEEAVERTSFYRGCRKFVRWVVNGRNFEKDVSFSYLPSEDTGSYYAHFDWRNPKPCWAAVSKLRTPVLFDFEAGFFVGLDCNKDGSSWVGWWGTKDEFVEKTK